MGRKRKNREGRGGAPTKWKRKTGGPRQGDDNAGEDTHGNGTSPPNTHIDEPKVDAIIKVELNSELEPSLGANNLEEFCNPVLEMDIGEVEVKALGYSKDQLELQIEDEGGLDFNKTQETEITHSNPNAGGHHAIASISKASKLNPTTTECENFAVAEDEANNKVNSDNSSHSCYWKLKSEKLANKKLELKKKTWELEADLAYWKGKAKELERSFLDVQAEPPELRDSHSAVTSCLAATVQSALSSGTSEKSYCSHTCPMSPIEESSDETETNIIDNSLSASKASKNKITGSEKCSKYLQRLSTLASVAALSNNNSKIKGTSAVIGSVSVVKDIQFRLSTDVASAMAKGYNLYEVRRASVRNQLHTTWMETPLKNLVNFLEISEGELVFLKISKIGDHLFITSTLDSSSSEIEGLGECTLSKINEAIYGKDANDKNDQQKFDIIVSLFDNLKLFEFIIIPEFMISNSLQMPGFDYNRILDLDDFDCKLVEFFRRKNHEASPQLMGITKKMSYLSSACSVSPVQVGGLGGIGSLTVNEGGGTKVLFVLPPAVKRCVFKEISDAISVAFTGTNKKLEDFSFGADKACIGEHKRILITPQFLIDRRIPFTAVFMRPGQLIHLASDAVYFGWSIESGFGKSKNILDPTFGFVGDVDSTECSNPAHVQEGNCFSPEERVILRDACFEMVNKGVEYSKKHFSTLPILFGKAGQMISNSTLAARTCILCGKVFNSNVLMKRHRIRTTCDKKTGYTCKHDGMYFESHEHIVRHYRKQHPGMACPDMTKKGKAMAKWMKKAKEKKKMLVKVKT